MRKFLARLLISFFLFFVCFPTPVFATDDNFDTAYDVTYTVTPDSITHVAIVATLTNTTGKYFASSYKVNVGSSNISNVTASDPDGPIPPNVQQDDDGYSIGVDFNKKVVGMGKSLVFKINFDTTSIAQSKGGIWEINIPGIQNISDFSTFDVHLRVPKEFGNPTYIKPFINSTTLDFTKDQLQTSGISLAFGAKQLYSFRLIYHLKNKNLFPIRTEVALPPTTNYQDVYITSVSKIPVNVTEDTDGNWLAQYSLAPSQALDITVQGYVQTYLTPRQQDESGKNLSLYLNEKPYWQVTDPTVVKLAKQLQTPYAIYEYVRNKLTYDFSRVAGRQERLGAVAALAKSYSAVCLEFTDLFVALSRAADIPAREVDGYAFTDNSKQRPLSKVQDILHAWPEYYDTDLKTWVMVDPTWGNTTGGVDYFNTLDFDHVAFVIKGSDSSYPIPAGGYKLQNNLDEKDVYMDIATTIPNQDTKLVVSTNFPKVIVPFLPVNGTITIRNNGPLMLPSQSVTITNPILLPKTQSATIPAIPPFGWYSIPLQYKKAPILTKKTVPVTIQIGSKIINQSLILSPLYLDEIVIKGGIAIGTLCGIIILIFAIKAWRVSLSRQK